MKQSDNIMPDKLTIQSRPSGSVHIESDKGHDSNYKRNAWLMLFGSSFLFWLMVATAVWNLWR